jgi:hypothetical protein
MDTAHRDDLGRIAVHIHDDPDQPGPIPFHDTRLEYVPPRTLGESLLGAADDLGDPDGRVVDTAAG